MSQSAKMHILRLEMPPDDVTRQQIFSFQNLLFDHFPKQYQIMTKNECSALRYLKCSSTHVSCKCFIHLKGLFPKLHR